MITATSKKLNRQALNSKMVTLLRLVIAACVTVCSLIAEGLHPPLDTALANKAMQRGMNFGNVFDQEDAVKQWGNSAAWVTLTPETLKSMAEMYYQKVFRSFRIPFTWGTIIDKNSTSGVFDQSHIKFTKYMDLVDYILNTYPVDREFPS